MFKFLLPVLTILLLPFVHSLGVETAEPEASLKPLHFNPHPYQYDRNTFHQNINYEASETNTLENTSPANGIYSQGPVQFPSNSDDYNENDLQPLGNPYERLALKSRTTKLRPSARRLDYNDLSSSVSKKQYAFSYTVRDATSGDDFSHTQKQEDGAVKGSYKVQLPDGRTQVVKYTADNNGYNAQVTYLDGQEQHGDYGSQSTQSPSLTAPALASAQPIYDYYKTLQEQELQHNDRVNYNDDDYADNRIYNVYPTTTPTPYYVHSRATPAGHYQNHIQNVHIKTYNTAPQNDGDRDDPLLVNNQQILIYPTTPAPYTDLHVLPTPRTLAYSTSSPYQNVVSPKSTNVLPSGHRYYVDYDYRGDNGEASKRSSYVAYNRALYYKTKK